MEIGVNVLGLEALFDGKIRPVLDFAAHADLPGPSTFRQPQTRPGTGSSAARSSSYFDPPYSIALLKNYQNQSTG
ncbi:hypothetical protein R3Q06_04160 [Rhodococcus erythropolis]|uniref:hypothetical protein n=1 Tax=Rhodococcus erythropolis TaxID=1833 RepID=UPI002948C518|nr:hypothetical protein [Rhodococcus erythropolis]MDV6272690.1 hypothetical protein [Rhodococcus erythropolis]